MTGRSGSDIRLVPPLTTERELYDLHLRAINYPSKKYGGLVRTYMKSETRRILTAIDALLYLTFVLSGANMAIGFWCLLLVILCASNFPLGPLSVTKLALSVVQDQLPMPKPSPESLRIGSPESMALIADYVAKQPLQEAESYVGRCEASLTAVEKSLNESEDLQTSLLSERQVCMQSLAPLYDAEIEEARDAGATLRLRREALYENIRLANQHLDSLRGSTGDLRTLAALTSRLRVVQENIEARTQSRDEELARRQLCELCDRIIDTREQLGGLCDIAVARAQATAEVKLLSRAS